MSTFDGLKKGFRLDSIEQEKTRDIGKLKERRSLAGSIENAIKEGVTPLIGEVKRASPSMGRIREVEPPEAASEMEEGGACAISVLTDAFFDGRICYLRQVKNAVSIPILRKDFIVDPFQLHESYGNGADAVLLIVSLLGEKTGDYVRKARELGMEALVEVHEEKELEYAIESGARLIGINNRNLKDLTIDLGTTERLAPMIPKDRIIVCESGIQSRQDIERMKDAGVSAFLVGSSIMSAPDITAKVRELTLKEPGR